VPGTLLGHEPEPAAGNTPLSASEGPRARPSGPHGGEHHGKAALATAALGALGIVYGDIGTSPLYAMRETFRGHGHSIVLAPGNVLGVLSLIFWSLVIVISIKYLVFVMRADNDGEGGILALTSLIRPRGGGHWALVLLGLFGTALLYGDGMITPAISVLAAVEGTEISSPALADYVVPAAVVIIVALFAHQSRGTATIGKLFGPIMLTWFAVLALLGIVQIVAVPAVLLAVSPLHGVRFFLQNGFRGFLALGSVFLVVTGGEALYADMGHFGKRPIQVGWYAFALPALLLNYFGQGALLLGDPAAIESPFYRLAPEWGVLPLVVLATAATVIASQALISGVFSLTMQAVQMGYAPRMRVVHTSARAIGQVYLPAVNWGLMLACVALVLGFGSSTALAAAYGVAVTSTMVITTLLFYVVVRERFGWSLVPAAALCIAFGVVDVAFLGANLFKIPAGGWFPLVVAAGVFTLMTTWRTGRRLVNERVRGGQVPLDSFVADLAKSAPPPQRVPGTAVYLSSRPGMTPPALIANVRSNNAMHRQVVVLSVVVGERPKVPAERRAELRDLGAGVQLLYLHYGFMEALDVPGALREEANNGLAVDVRRAAFILGAEWLVVTDRPGMAQWRERLFAVMSRNATPAGRYFGLPLEQTVILVQRVEL
jgi:KUP system potassium uptake protein